MTSKEQQQRLIAGLRVQEHTCALPSARPPQNFWFVKENYTPINDAIRKS